MALNLQDVIISSANSNTTIIRVDALRRWSLYLVAALLICIPVFVTADSNAAGGAMFVIFLAMAPALAVLFYVAQKTRLVISGDALEYYNVGVSAVAKWANVERLLVAPGVCGLVLKEPLDQPGMQRMSRFAGMAVAGNNYYSEQQQTLIRECRFIDLRAYRTQLLKGDLAATFAAFHPELRIDIEN